jgi:hypothetical protein
LILTVNTYLFKYVPVKLGFIILSLIGVLRIPEEFYLYKDKDKAVVPLNRNENGRFGALKSDSTHHFFRNASTKSGSLRFSQFSGC